MQAWSNSVFANEAPKYLALADSIEQHIHAGALLPGERLPTHRELANLLHCNVSTITRGYREAERRGLVTGTVGRGTFVSPPHPAAIFQHTDVPHPSGMIELGLTSPFYGLDPDINEGLAQLARQRNLCVHLHYSAPEGLPEHRETGAEWAGIYGIETTEDNVVVCAGAQHALTCIMSEVFESGDCIATAPLCYPGLQRIADTHGITLLPITSDDEGMIPEALHEACCKQTIRGIHVMPECHTPTNVKMGKKRRERIAEIAERHHLIIIEDDAYALTQIPLAGIKSITKKEQLSSHKGQTSAPHGSAYASTSSSPAHGSPTQCAGGVASQSKHQQIAPCTPISMLLPDQSIHIAGFSKVLCAGLRIAYVTAKGELQRAVSNGVRNTMWMAPTLTAALASLWIKNGTALHTVKRKQKEAVWRNTEASRILTHIPYHGTTTGHFLWIPLPDMWQGKGDSFETLARRHRINVFCAERFSITSDAPAAIRVALSGAHSREELSFGLKTLAKIWQMPPEPPAPVF